MICSHSVQGTCRYTLPETNIAPENQWLEDDSCPFGARPIARDELFPVLGRVSGIPLPRNPPISRLHCKICTSGRAGARKTTLSYSPAWTGQHGRSSVHRMRSIRVKLPNDLAKGCSRGLLMVIIFPTVDNATIFSEFVPQK